MSGCHQQLPFDNPLIEVELNFIEECAQFPNGRHDDQVDQMTQALLKMSSRPPARELPPREPMPVSPYGGTQGGNWML